MTICSTSEIFEISQQWAFLLKACSIAASVTILCLTPMGIYSKGWSENMHPPQTVSSSQRPARNDLLSLC